MNNECTDCGIPCGNCPHLLRDGDGDNRIKDPDPDGESYED